MHDGPFVLQVSQSMQVAVSGSYLRHTPEVWVGDGGQGDNLELCH